MRIIKRICVDQITLLALLSCVEFQRFIKLVSHYRLSEQCPKVMGVCPHLQSAKTHKVAMSLSNSDHIVLDKTKFGVEGDLKDFEIPLTDLYEICFDGR